MIVDTRESQKRTEGTICPTNSMNCERRMRRVGVDDVMGNNLHHTRRKSFEEGIIFLHDPTLPTYWTIP
ncbi:hypothetical protein M413DRAFT_448355 [Hebeloma cylindrosporum]|uniref:Uncharacterized protein n=1 Tax=Hebeloma cylindrosporum TaxID=76867 RepID=A0A0C2Y926_HEBCY|nr:hypothetical protein M413DRAFT_448355 [Hebeloma cylindrosporum h7]